VIVKAGLTGLAAVILAAAVLLGAGAPRPSAPSALVLIGATLIDGTGAPPVPDAVVVVRDGRIAAAGPRGKVAIPEGARVEDLAGRFLVPGFFDMHAHVTILFGSMDAKGYDAATSAVLADVGTLEPGKRADLVVLAASPLQDIHNTRRIERVMQGGVWRLSDKP
jgi:imidazolonepropionase-like amidohydrolase